MRQDDERTSAGLHPVPDPVEEIKAKSRFLRGTIAAGLRDPITGAVSEEDRQLLKFHGIYQQDDRDLRDERRRQKLEPAYQFMVRVRIPGGVLRPEQWLALDSLARRYANGTLRLTSRQSIQLHGVLKHDLRPTLRAIHEALLTTLATCGDVNRNVMCSPEPEATGIHREVSSWAERLSTALLPRTRAYHEIWLDGEKITDGSDDTEPLYGPTYLPRKFKIAFAVPPKNDVDVFAQDLGFIAIVEEDRLAGFDISVGGGLGMSDQHPGTYPRLGQVIGFVPVDAALAVAEAVIAIQRDFGDRSDRRHARLKYTIDDRGIDWFRAELEARLGFPLLPPRPFRFTTTSDRFGWAEDLDGLSFLTLFVPEGRVRDDEEVRLLSGLRALAEVGVGEFRLTPNQNLILAGIRPEERPLVEEVVAAFGLDHQGLSRSALRRNAMACVALPTCPLAMAEAERYLPRFLARLEHLLSLVGLPDLDLGVRISGCPNGCSRPYLAEVALTGRAPGRYNLYLGGGRTGERLNVLYRANLSEDEILEALRPLLQRFRDDRLPGESFGDFVLRMGLLSGEPRGAIRHRLS